MRDLLGSLRLRTRRISDWPGVVDRLASGAAYLAQGSIYSYLRARTLLAGPRLFQDDGFGAVLETCKWEGFGMAAQDLILILERDLRGRLPHPAETVPAFAALYADVLAFHPVPAHRAADGWADLKAAFAPRLAAAMAAPPMEIEKIAVATATRLMDFAPVEPSIRLSDIEMVTNNTAFRFVDFKRQLSREVDLDALARLLAGHRATALA